MKKVVWESVGTVKEFGTRKILEGKALEPTISLNGNIYSAEEIDAAKNLNVPLRADWEHDVSKVIGTVEYTLNPQEHALYYRAEITEPNYAREIKEGVHKVSIEAGVDEAVSSCTRKRCYNLIQGLTMEGIGITATPGVQSTTLKIIEKYQDWEPIKNNKCVTCEAIDIGSPDSCNCAEGDKKCLSNCSHNDTNKESNLMTKEMTECPEGQSYDEEKGKCVSKESEGPSSQSAGVEQTKPSENPCGEGKKLLDGKCVPADNTESKKENCGCSKNEVANQDEISKSLKEMKEMISSAKEIINKTTEKEVSELQRMEKFNKNLYNTAKISTTGAGIRSFSKDDLSYIATEGKSALKKFGAYSFDIDLSNEWVKESLNRNKIQEAISFSGDQSNKAAAMNDVFVLPGGKYLKSIRDLVRFVDIPDGTDQIKLFKGDIPNNGTITEGSTTSASTHTVTTITLSADTVTGVAQLIKQADLEDSPFSVFDYIAQTARAEVLESEATLVFTTAAAAATPGLWINANSGATITHTDIASMTQDHTSVAVGLQHYETQGYDTSFGNIGYYLHPKALRELRTSSNLVRLVQEGDANITKTGRLTHLYGVELIPGTAVDTDDNTTNDVYNNVMFVKGHTFALGSKRDLTIDMRKIPAQSAYDWAWSQRKNATTFDATSFVRISSAQ